MLHQLYKAFQHRMRQHYPCAGPATRVDVWVTGATANDTLLFPRRHRQRPPRPSLCLRFPVLHTYYIRALTHACIQMSPRHAIKKNRKCSNRNRRENKEEEGKENQIVLWGHCATQSHTHNSTRDIACVQFLQGSEEEEEGIFFKA